MHSIFAPRWALLTLTSLLWLALFLSHLCLIRPLHMGREKQQPVIQGWPSLICRLQTLLVWFWRSDSALISEWQYILTCTFVHCSKLKPITFQTYERLILPHRPKYLDFLASLCHWFYYTKFGYFQGQHRHLEGYEFRKYEGESFCYKEGHCNKMQSYCPWIRMAFKITI